MFTNPSVLIALSLLALPIIIHALVRFSGRKMRFPTLRFLRQTESQRLRLISIKRWPLLAFRLLAMALLVLAISGPVLMKENRSRVVLLLIDSSLSMKAATIKEQTASRARETLSALDAADVAAVAQFDGSVKLLQDFTSDRVALEHAIAAYSPRFRAADFGAALKWASEKLASQPGSRELVFISDLQSSNLHALPPTRLNDVDLKIVRINNERRANARIDSVMVRAVGETLEVESTALFDDGNRTRIEPVNSKLNRSGANGSTSNALISARLIEDDLLAGEVRTSAADDFDADDARFFVAGVAGAEKIMVVQPSTDQSTYIEKALQANSSAAVAKRQDALPVNADSFEGIHTIIAPVGAISEINIAAAREHVRKGGSLVLTVGAETDVRSATAKLKALDEQFSSLALDSFALDSIAPNDSLGLRQPAQQGDDVFDEETIPVFASVRFYAAAAIRLSEGETQLRYSNGEPAAVRVRAGDGRILLLGFGLSDKDSSLVRSPIFPAFIEWLITPAHRQANLIIGQTPVLRGLTGLKRIYSGNGQAHAETISDYQRALEEPGVYDGEDSKGRIVFALNTPVAESSLAQSSEQEFLQRVAVDKAGASKTDSTGEKTDLWMIIAICALSANLLELVYSEFKRARQR
ncbi:MAG: BatA and WFA domain-containing protein [Blastocatellia bacterium]